MRCQVPVLFLVFNRPQHTRVSLERIRMAQPAKLYIHCDAARPDHPGDAEKVAEVRALIQEKVDWACEVKTLYRTENQGLRAGVGGALNWFFDLEPYGIVLEDDCVPDLTFFPFCGELLEYYLHDEQIMHIGCSNLAEEYTRESGDSYVFSRFSFVWGWAGWRRAWKKMSIDLEGLDEFEQSGMIGNLIKNRGAQIYMTDKFRVTQRRENQSWAYAWFYSILKNNGLCIVSSINLVQNVGVGESGATHTTKQNKKAQLEARSIRFPLKHPANRDPNPQLEQRFFHLSQKSRLRLRAWLLLRKLRKLWRSG